MYNSSQSSFPPQFVLESEKTEEWANQWVNAVVAYMSYVESPYKNSRLNDIQNYNIYNGTLDLEDFKYITEQYGMAYPARLVNYPIISPKIDLLVGEDLRRPLDVKVSTTNKEAVLRKEDKKVGLIMRNILESIHAEFEEKEGVFEMAERITLPDGKHPTLTASTSGSKIDTKYWMTEKQKEFLCDETRLKKKYTAIDGNKALTMTGAYARWQGTHIQTDKKPFNKSDVRKLTPKEAERLQTLPDNYTEGVSDTQRYKMIGNGFTSLVIAHILSYMKDNPKPLKFQRQVKLL